MIFTKGLPKGIDLKNNGYQKKTQTFGRSTSIKSIMDISKW